MGFIERLRQEQAAEALIIKQQRIQREASETARLQKEANECERHAKRREQAGKFREESGVGAVVAKLGEFLSIPTVPVEKFIRGEEKGTVLIGRGSHVGPVPSWDYRISQSDPDSLLDIVSWDEVHHDIGKIIAVESCPDGSIIFHGGWSGSTTIRATSWRNKDKEQLFDRALEKAYRHPVHYRVFVNPSREGGFTG